MCDENIIALMTFLQLHTIQTLAPPLLPFSRCPTAAKAKHIKPCAARRHAVHCHRKPNFERWHINMEIKLTLDGKSRKEAAACIGSAIGQTPVYQRAPTYAYQIGDLTLDRHSVVTIGDSDTALPQVLSALTAAGFYTPESPVPATTSTNPDRYVVKLPAADFTPAALDNLQKLVASKATLLKKAIDTESLSIERKGKSLHFPWFNINPTPEEADAYAQLVTALGEMAKKQQRILATDKPVDNEKYAFRCFLLRLGFIGEGFAASRAILLRNLSGNGSHKSGEAPLRKPKQPVTVQEKSAETSEAVSTEVAPDPQTQPARKARLSVKKLFGALKLMALD